jgi:hypothetical protein
VLTDKSQSILQTIQAHYLIRPTNPVWRTAHASILICLLIKIGITEIVWSMAWINLAHNRD